MKRIALTFMGLLSAPNIALTMADNLSEEDRTAIANNCVTRLTASGMPKERAIAHLQEYIKAEEIIHNAHLQIVVATRKLKELAGERKLSNTDQKDLNQILQFLLDNTDFNGAKKLFSNSNQ